MAIISFKQYLHDEWEEGAYQIVDQTGYQLTETEADKLGRPFYQVSVTCEVDTDAGTVTATEFNGVPLSRPVRL
jgi:hypothetical protein